MPKEQIRTEGEAESTAKASINEFDRLSERERAIVEYASRGLTDKEISRELAISVGTLTTYWYRIRHKTGLRSRAQIASEYVEKIAMRQVDCSLAKLAPWLNSGSKTGENLCANGNTTCARNKFGVAFISPSGHVVGADDRLAAVLQTDPVELHEHPLALVRLESGITARITQIDDIVGAAWAVRNKQGDAVPVSFICGLEVTETGDFCCLCEPVSVDLPSEVNSEPKGHQPTSGQIHIDAESQSATLDRSACQMIGLIAPNRGNLTVSIDNLVAKVAKKDRVALLDFARKLGKDPRRFFDFVISIGEEADVRRLHLLGAVSYGDDGKPKGASCRLLDTSELSPLMPSNRHLGVAALELASIGNIFIDISEPRAEVDTNACMLLGLTQEPGAVHRDTIREHIHPKDRDTFFRLLDKHSAQGPDVYSTFLSTKKSDGSQVYLQSMQFILRDVTGVATKAVIMIRPIEQTTPRYFMPSFVERFGEQP